MIVISLVAVGRPLQHDLSELAQMPAKSIDRLGPLPDQKLAHAKHHRRALRLSAHAVNQV